MSNLPASQPVDSTSLTVAPAGRFVICAVVFDSVREGERYRLALHRLHPRIRDDDRSVRPRHSSNLHHCPACNRQRELLLIRTQGFCNRFRIRIGDFLGINYLYRNIRRIS